MIRNMVDADLRFVALVNPATPFLPHFRSVEIDGKVVAIFGYQTVCTGVGQTWVCVNPQSTRNPLAIIRAGKHLAQVAMKKFSLHRLQTAVLASDYRMCKMMELVGFTAECVMKCASARGDDLVMYRVLKED